jgi:uncharacterized protein YndB with AHSA1/START domain
MGTHSFIVTRVANAPREKVWALFADGARWKDWAGVVKSSLERKGVPAPDGVGAIRRLGPSPFASREEVVVWEPPSHLGYVILSGMPVRNYRADIRLTERVGGAVGAAEDVGASGTSKVTTVIEWSATFDPKVPGTGALLKVGLGAILGRFAKRAARYAEKRSA